MVKLSFVGGSTGEPLISKLSKDFQVAGNILFGNVEILQETPVGTLLLVLSGSPDKIAEAVRFLQDSDVTVTIIEPDEIEARKVQKGEE